MRFQENLILGNIYDNIISEQHDLKGGVKMVDDLEMYWSSRKEKGTPPIGFQVPVWNLSTNAHPRFKLAEDTLEGTRKRVNPNAPSRLNCVYVCPGRDGWCSMSNPNSELFRVSVTGKIYQTDAQIYSDITNYILDHKIQHADERLLGLCENYWKPWHYQQLPEVLVDGTVTIMDKA